MNNQENSNLNIFTVTEITKHVKNILENNIPAIWIKGEISNFKHHSSGHIYLTLKDQNCSLRAVFFRQFNRLLRFQPENGMEVMCYGKIQVYEKSGQYQLNINEMKPLGIGELEIAFRQLKEKLEFEGLFEEKWKKPIPRFPASVGIITSQTGAAIQDIKNVLTRRFPVNILLHSVRVQGKTSADEIVTGIEAFNKSKNVDVLIVTRGGGSMEDLWSFNEEKVARAIFKSEIPIISGVGHEIDFTISDFVADLRAPTPSAAAELVVPDRYSVLNEIKNFDDRINNLVLNKFEREKSKCRELFLYLDKFHPQNILQQYTQQLDELKYRLNNSLLKISDSRFTLEKLKSNISYQFNKFHNLQNAEIREKQNSLWQNFENIFAKKRSNWLNLMGKLDELSPLKILKRGYSVVTKNGKDIISTKDLELEDKLRILFSEGKCDCKIQNIYNNISDE
ncbi:MAG: exodeoxyribonuclease VII large subunit [Candidatus Cloacimonadota bacterium]|nr:exodeoxyribonuclease VII large subunit [Candidatus Cloacimonadota bacterium]